MLKHALLFPALSASSGVGFFSFSVLSRPDCRLPSIVRCVSEPGGSTELAGSIAHGRRARGEEGLPQPAGVGGRFHPQGLLRLLKERLRGRGGHHLPRGVRGWGAEAALSSPPPLVSSVSLRLEYPGVCPRSSSFSYLQTLCLYSWGCLPPL